MMDAQWLTPVQPPGTSTRIVYQDLSDDELLAECRARREGAWSVLVRRFQRLIYTVPMRAGLSEAAAADVFQITFARLVEHIGDIEDGSRVKAWLVTTARRETLRHLERAKREVELPGTASDDEDADDPWAQLPDERPLPPDELAHLQEHDRLRRAVDLLDPRSRQFIELMFLQDEPLPYAELAARLNIAEGSIGPTRARCLAKLRAVLEGLD